MINPEFLLTSLVVVLIPGTGVVYTISTGLTLKGRASIAAAVGCTLGIGPHMLASILGLSAPLNMSAQVFSVLKIAGSISVVFMMMTLVIFILYGILTSGIRTYLTNSSNVMKRAQQVFALIFAGFAVRLALSEK